MDTAMTLAGLVCLILYGSPGRKKYNSINFIQSFHERFPERDVGFQVGSLQDDGEWVVIYAGFIGHSNGT